MYSLLVSSSPVSKITLKGPIVYDFGPTILNGKKRKINTIHLSSKRVRELLYITINAGI